MTRIALGVLAALIALPAAACPLDIDHSKLKQGALVIGKTTPGTKLEFYKRVVRVDAATGAFVIGFDRDAPAAMTLAVTCPDGKSEPVKLAIAKRKYSIERLTGLPEEQVTPPPELLERIKREDAVIRAARADDNPLPYFLQGFQWPAKGRLSGFYGDQRFLNGEPRAPHLGLDIAGPVGTPIAATAAGIVTMAERDLFYTGGTVVIDHGHGVNSVYSHLSEVRVAVGDKLAAGQNIGRMGKTGRVTGPHLHFNINWFQLRLDPALVLGPQPPA
ncbi:MAG: M23 family metallopeptidase [Alphaproteobacteria bacterium]|nr:M23 family metallopeptidase [Alphaproteobacteria bacterium]